MKQWRLKKKKKGLTVIIPEFFTVTRFLLIIAKRALEKQQGKINM